MDYYPSPREAIKLAELRQKDVKKYEDLMKHLFFVYTDFVVFDKQFVKAVKELEVIHEKEEKK